MRIHKRRYQNCVFYVLKTVLIKYFSTFAINNIHLIYFINFLIMNFRLLILLIAFVLIPKSSIVYAQDSTNPNTTGSSLAYLEKTFPKLTDLYKSDLQNCHTHYIFAVDVSGSMIKYNEIVTPALQAFAQALPPGEQVSIIPFGTEAKENTPGLCCKIQDASQKQVLSNSLSTLYVNDGYSKEFRHNTDVNKAVAAVNKAILNNQEVQMNVVVIITDFLNDLPGVGEQKLKEADLEKLNKDFDNVTDNTYTRVVAMQLPKAGTGVGFCLDQLQESVFCNTSITKKFDVIQAIKDKNAISHWFEQLSRDIMTEKLKAVIQLDNERNLRPTLKTKIDIDGNTTAEIHWTPNKLYKQIKIEATNTDANSDYVFDNNEEVWQVTTDTALVDLKLGKLKKKNWGFWNYDEKLNIGMSLPTDYDDELKKLSIDKPIQATSDKQSGWLFTFLLPFWLTVTLIVLFIVWLYGFIKAIARNSRTVFIGTIDAFKGAKHVLNDISVRKSGTLLIGNNGNCECGIDGAEWQIAVTKIKGNPLFWGSPKFKWSQKLGSVRKNKSKSGFLYPFSSEKNKRIVTLSCGPSYDEVTHTVDIKLANKNKY